MACPPSRTAGRSLYAPPNFPMGVRAPSTITEGMGEPPGRWARQPLYERAAFGPSVGGDGPVGRLAGEVDDQLVAGPAAALPCGGGGVPGRLAGEGAPCNRVVEDVEDLVPHQLVAGDQGIPERLHQV